LLEKMVMAFIAGGTYLTTGRNGVHELHVDPEPLRLRKGAFRRGAPRYCSQCKSRPLKPNSHPLVFVPKGARLFLQLSSSSGVQDSDTVVVPGSVLVTVAFVGARYTKARL
jgi:hypothetical protein